MYEPHPDYWYDSEMWMWEYINDNTRIVSIYEGTDLDEADIRNKHFAVDITWHRNNYFWNANDASLISYGRNPDKVVDRDKYVPSDDDLDEQQFKKHNELWDAITERRLLIEDAQSKGVLPDPFPPAMYIDWGKRLGFTIARFVVADLETVDSERKAFDSKQDTKAGSQQKRFDNNLIKVLGAILVHTKLDKKEPAALSTALEGILFSRASELHNKKINLSARTIEERLVEARELLE